MAEGLTDGGGVEGGGASSDAFAAGNNSIPKSITNKHNILHLIPYFQILSINPSLHVDNKPPTPTPLRRRVQRRLDRPVMPRPILRHHKIRPRLRRLQQPPIPARNPRRKPISAVITTRLMRRLAVAQRQRVAYQPRDVVVGHQRQHEVGDAELREPGPARLEVGQGGAQPRLHVEVGAFRAGIYRLVELLDRVFVQLHAVGPRRLLAAVPALAS